MNRYIFEISYNGKDFFGWQRQPRQVSVQQEIEDSLTKLNHNEKIVVVGCGRTDSGVHAKRYILHVDLPDLVYNSKLIFKLNRMLPNGIVVHEIKQVSPDFHARFDAKSRTYRYFIHQQKDAFNSNFSWYFPSSLNVDSMNEACKYLMGKQDFTSLSKLHTDVKTNICEITIAKWVKTSENELYFEITANRFLRNMVRATVGTLIEIGEGKINPKEMKTILEQKDRGAAKASVPAHALFLWDIEY